MRSISPSIDPLGHRAAIDALEAQRAAYRRFARQAEAQQGALGAGAGAVDPVAEFVDGAAFEVDRLGEGARSAHALVERSSRGASDVELAEIERRMTDMMREARNAETAIHNLTTQLQAWHDAFGRQLGEVGITPGEGTTPATPGTRPGYGSPSPSPEPRARILDRKG